MVEQKIVLLGAGSAAFAPATLTDINFSKTLKDLGATIVLVDINETKLEMMFDIVNYYNDKFDNKFNIEMTTDRKKALKNADFVICSVEKGDRFELRWQDNTIPRKHGTT